MFSGGTYNIEKDEVRLWTETAQALLLLHVNQGWTTLGTPFFRLPVIYD
jgi:hypothetical protein